jgi:hypothetical protein
MKTNEEVGKEVLAELRERAQQPESDKVTASPQHFFVSSPKSFSEEKNASTVNYKNTGNYGKTLYKKPHPQNVQLHYVQLQKVQLPNVQLQNVQDTKRPGYKTTCYQTSRYRTSRIQNVQDTKRPVFVNLKTCLKNKKPKAEHT